MRKDVRFGLTIGAILLAVLVVYVLVVPGGKSPTAEQVSLDTIDSADPSAPAATDADGGEPSVLDTPRAADATAPVAPQDSPIINPGPARPADIASTATPDNVMAPEGNYDWAAILRNGVVDQRSMLVATTDRRGSVAANPVPVRTEGIVSDEPTTPPVIETADRAPTTAPVNTTAYTIEAGDNFSAISQKLYGDARHYLAIERANPGVDSRKLKVGQTINVPDRASLADVDQAVQASSPAPTAGGEAQGGGVARTTIDETKQYRVQAADSLYKIAQKLYGDGNRWQELHQANRATIGDNPANLKVGQVLTLPAAPTQASAAQ